MKKTQTACLQAILKGIIINFLKSLNHLYAFFFFLFFFYLQGKISNPTQICLSPYTHTYTNMHTQSQPTTIYMYTTIGTYIHTQIPSPTRIELVCIPSSIVSQRFGKKGDFDGVHNQSLAENLSQNC